MELGRENSRACRPTHHIAKACRSYPCDTLQVHPLMASLNTRELLASPWRTWAASGLLPSETQFFPQQRPLSETQIRSYHPFLKIILSGQRTRIEICPKKMYRWPIRIGKDAHHYSYLEKCKSKP